MTIRITHFLLVSNQILEERLAARRQRIQQFYDVMHKIQMATGVSDMGKLAEEFFSQDVSAARCLGAACLCTLTTSMNVRVCVCGLQQTQYQVMLEQEAHNAQRLVQLRKQGEELRATLDKLRVYGVYNARHSKVHKPRLATSYASLVLLLTCQLLLSFTSQLDEKDQELELAVNAATKEKAAWATKRKVRHVSRRSMCQAHSHTECLMCCCSCSLKLQAGSCPSSSASAFPVLARLLKPWRHMVPLWPRQTSMNTHTSPSACGAHD